MGNGCRGTLSVYPFSIRCRFNAREGSGVFSTRGTLGHGHGQPAIGFNAREGSGVFSTVKSRGVQLRSWRFNAREGSGVFSTEIARLLECLRREVSTPVRALGSFLRSGWEGVARAAALASFNAREGSGVFSTLPLP